MKKFLTVLLIFTMIFAMAACGSSSSATDTSDDSSVAETTDDTIYTLTFSFEDEDNNFMVANWINWCEQLTELSDGRLQFTYYYSNTLLDASSEMEQLKAGIADLACAKRYASDGFIINEGWKLLGAGIDPEKQVEYSYEFFEEFPEAMAEFDGLKVLAMSFVGGSPYQLLTVNKAVESPEDMKGLTIWCETDWNAFVEACGATPVNTPWSEVYSSLQKNMYDGMMIPAETLETCNFAEVCSYVTLLNFGILSGAGWYMNLDTYNSLPSDLQALIDDEDLISELETANTQDGIALRDDALDWSIENYGTTVIELTSENSSAFLDKLAEGKESLAADLDAQGYSGTEMVALVTEMSKR